MSEPGFKFKIGQQVAADGFEASHYQIGALNRVQLPVNGKVYTIRGRSYLPGDILNSTTSNGIGYVLEEIVNAPDSCWCLTTNAPAEIHFDEFFFKPLVSATMQDLLALQNPANHKNLQPIEPLLQPKPVRRPGFLPAIKPLEEIT